MVKSKAYQTYPVAQMSVLFVEIIQLDWHSEYITISKVKIIQCWLQQINRWNYKSLCIWEIHTSQIIATICTPHDSWPCIINNCSICWYIREAIYTNIIYNIFGEVQVAYFVPVCLHWKYQVESWMWEILHQKYQPFRSMMHNC